MRFFQNIWRRKYDGKVLLARKIPGQKFSLMSFQSVPIFCENIGVTQNDDYSLCLITRNILIVDNTFQTFDKLIVAYGTLFESCWRHPQLQPSHSIDNRRKKTLLMWIQLKGNSEGEQIKCHHHIDNEWWIFRYTLKQLSQIHVLIILTSYACWSSQSHQWIIASTCVQVSSGHACTLKNISNLKGCKLSLQLVWLSNLGLGDFATFS